MRTGGYTITDRDGDKVTVDRSDETTPEGHVDLRIESDGHTPLTVYVSPAELREIADAAGAILGEPRKEAVASATVTLSPEFKESIVEQLQAYPLIDAAKGLLRQAMPEGDGYVLLDLGGER